MVLKYIAYFVFLAFLMIGFTLSYSPEVFAQSDGVPQNSVYESPSTQKPPPAPDVDFSEATDEEIEESQAFYRNCTKNETIKSQQDCRCLSVEYLLQRMVLGPNAEPAQILANLREECVIDPDADLSDVSKGDLSEITDEQLEEAQGVYDQCQNDWRMKIYHDCKCLATKYLDQRLALGPVANGQNILAFLEDECPNSVDIAGHTYTQCLSNPVLLPEGIKLEDFCECYGSTFAKNYTSGFGLPSQPSKKVIALRARAQCRNELTPQ